MPKYLCLQRTCPNQAGTDPSQQQDMYVLFEAWMRKYKDNLSDMGGKLGSGRIEMADGASSAELAKVHELVGGYMIVTADNIDEAGQIARDCPGLVGPGSGCELIEISTPGE